MIHITIKHSSLAFVVAAFATVMIIGTISFVADDSVFAHRGHFFHFNDNNGRHSSIHQSISQSCNQNQQSTVLTTGAGSPILGSGNNIATCANFNAGGNVAAIN
jgi:hypothetical protein